MPTKPNKTGGHKESTIKIIQNNDSSDDPKSWKQNGGTDKETRHKDWKDTEMFNKDLEEIKKSQPIINKATTEIKSTLEGTNSRITEVGERIGEVEDRMVEINEAQRKKEKKN